MGWYYLDGGAGVPVRCAERRYGMIECAAYDGINCLWGHHGNWTKQANMEPLNKEVKTTKNARRECPSWPAKDGTDACERLGCGKEGIFFFLVLS